MDEQQKKWLAMLGAGVFAVILTASLWLLVSHPGPTRLSHDERTAYNLRVIVEAMIVYRDEFGSFPESNGWCQALVRKNLITSDYCVDGWGNEFVYSPADGKYGPTVYSLGPDGEDDGGMVDDVVAFLYGSPF